MLLVTFFIGITLLVLFYYFHSRYKFWKERNIPTPPISYLFGNIKDVLLFKKSLGLVYCEIYNQYSDLPYIGIYRPQTPCILIRDPELVKEVMVRQFSSYHDNDVPINEKNDPYFAKNPFASKGDQWKENRSRSAPSFTAKRIKEMFPLMEGVAQQLVEYLKLNSKSVDAKELCLMFTTDLVANCALGVNANSFQNLNSEYIKMVKLILSPSFMNNISLTLIFVFPSLANFLKIKFIPDEAAAYCKSIVKQTLEYRSKNNIKRGDFLDSMNELRNSLSFDDITAHVLSFFTDGTETSSIVLSFTLYELGLHPDIQSNLYNEIEGTIRGNKGELSYEKIHEMKYLDSVINENMRKNTPGYFLSRICTEKVELGSPYENSKRVVIEPGTPMIIPLHAIHNDPRYFSNPSVYDPLRFFENDSNTRSTGKFLPFGEGPRTCLGQRFGITQIKVAIVYLVKTFEITISTDTTVPYQADPRYLFLAAKGGIRLDFCLRNND